MRSELCRLIALVLLWGPAGTGLLAQSSGNSGTGSYEVHIRDREAVLFPFDHEAIPFRSGLEVSLQKARRYKNNPVLRVGERGQPDSVGVALYGTVIPIGGEFRMWYLCAGDREKGAGFSWMPGVRWRVCYATSKDGINWQKPDLGLVEYGGNTRNNLVALEPIKGDAIASVVIYEPDAADPQKRFKMIYENPGLSNSAAYSPDGLRWTNSSGNPVTKSLKLEPSGLIKYNGLYYLIGQGGFKKRVLVVAASPDFEHWTEAVSLGFRRDSLGLLQPRPFGGKTGEQVHLGASLWDRENVILGFYGQWHGPDLESDDRRDMRMDVGLVISHDALHYYEPIPDFKIIPAGDEKFAVLGFSARLVQAQGFLNVGGQTLTYYSLWGPGGADGVYLATWDRDRLGWYSVPSAATEGQEPVKGVEPQFISCPIWIDKPRANVYVNAGGLGEHSQVTVEVLDDKFQPIPGLSGADSLPLKKQGFREQVLWRGGESLHKFSHPIRLRVKFGGLQMERARVYAVYLD
jgi:hypothetical protein